MALSWGSEAPEQMTKKSVNDERPRRSMAMMSSAFLSAAMVAHRRARDSELMADSLVEAVLSDDRAHRFRYQIADAAPFGNPLANLGGRDVDPALDAEEVVRGGVGVAFEDDEAGDFQEVVVPAPFGQVGDVVLSDEVKEFVGGKAGAPGFQGINGKAGAGAVKLGVVALEAGFARDGGLDHGEADGGWRGLTMGFERRNGGGNEHDAIERQLLQCLARQEQMAVVNGIETPPVKRGAHGGRFNVQHLTFNLQHPGLIPRFGSARG